MYDIASVTCMLTASLRKQDRHVHKVCLLHEADLGAATLRGCRRQRGAPVVKGLTIAERCCTPPNCALLRSTLIAILPDL